MDMEFPVPKKDQTNNEKVADNFIGFKNTTIIYCDGKDVFDSLSAMKRAKEIIANGHEARDCTRGLCTNRFSLQF